ncbi:avidin-domain-containing protein [Cylindrobasidium torrendii FP15055 ss-10]|uniref:Avidin-domain-containing protein n=1 Tax=Cylindrobasidium torrendii FP15055 ss-10 TaxID=1314674 RepID=A0A0D7B393_9AGAR|nr:avidin-domain-containing protein [Cylindrobasidium torrendii FP15055 ss-10]
MFVSAAALASAVALINGTWHNQLGSTVVFDVDQNGTLSGQYNSAVGNAEDFYVLTGRYETDPVDNQGLTLGWTVNYHNDLRDAHSTATWSGQYFGGDEEVIQTHWLLTRSTALEDLWESTHVGTDVFSRGAPTQEKIQSAFTVGSPTPDQILAKN